MSDLDALSYYLGIDVRQRKEALTLEVIAVLHARAGDDQVIHIHADDELLLPPSPCVERMLGCTPLKPKLAQCGVKLGVSCSRGLPQPVECLA